MAESKTTGMKQFDFMMFQLMSFIWMISTKNSSKYHMRFRTFLFVSYSELVGVLTIEIIPREKKYSVSRTL